MNIPQGACVVSSFFPSCVLFCAATPLSQGHSWRENGSSMVIAFLAKAPWIIETRAGRTRSSFAVGSNDHVYTNRWKLIRKLTLPAAWNTHVHTNTNISELCSFVGGYLTPLSECMGQLLPSLSAIQSIVATKQLNPSEWHTVLCCCYVG